MAINKLDFQDKVTFRGKKKTIEQWLDMPNGCEIVQNFANITKSVLSEAVSDAIKEQGRYIHGTDVSEDFVDIINEDNENSQIDDYDDDGI